jgi:hypothetical protein
MLSYVIASIFSSVIHASCYRCLYIVICSKQLDINPYRRELSATVSGVTVDFRCKVWPVEMHIRYLSDIGPYIF